MSDVKPMAVFLKAATPTAQITARTGGGDLLFQFQIDLLEGGSDCGGERGHRGSSIPAGEDADQTGR